jgi:hypothetical protein
LTLHCGPSRRRPISALYPQPAFDQYYAAKKADASWRTYEVDGGHDVMVDRPERLVEILLEAS